MSTDFITVLTWIEGNLTWIETNWDTLLSVGTKIIAGASVLAAFLPGKNRSNIVNKLHNYVNTDAIHKIIDVLAFNVGNTLSKAKANDLLNVKPVSDSTPDTTQN